eukprot:2549169-Rhodomonas_salina.4
MASQQLRRHTEHTLPAAAACAFHTETKQHETGPINAVLLKRIKTHLVDVHPQLELLHAVHLQRLRNRQRVVPGRGTP